MKQGATYASILIPYYLPEKNKSQTPHEVKKLIF